jgi:hypothetical protein
MSGETTMSLLVPCALACILAADPTAGPGVKVNMSVAVGPIGLGQITLTAIGRRLPIEPIEQALQAAFKSPVPATHATDAMVMWSAFNVPMAPVDGAGGDIELDLTPLFSVLRAEGIRLVHVTVVVPGTESNCEIGGRAIPRQAQPATSAYQVFQGDAATDTFPPVLVFGFETPDPPESSTFGFDFFSVTPGDPAWLWLLTIVPAGAVGLLIPAQRRSSFLHRQSGLRKEGLNQSRPLSQMSESYVELLV